MRYAATYDYPFTVDYYSVNNEAPANNVPIWTYNYIKSVRVNLAAVGVSGKLTMTCPEALVIGYVIKNFKDADGNEVLNDLPLSPIQPNINIREYRINSCDPVLNPFGSVDWFSMQIQQLNLLRPA